MIKKKKVSIVFLICCIFIGLVWPLSVLAVVDISQDPAEAQLDPAVPNMMFIVDDSKSMDWEIMSAESGDSCFTIPDNSYNAVSTNPSSDTQKVRYFVFGAAAATDSDPEHNAYGYNSEWGYTLQLKHDNRSNTNTNKDERRYYKPQWNGFNTIFYNPRSTYKKWYGKSDASTSTPLFHPALSDTSANRITLSNTYIKIKTNLNVTADILNAHYYVKSSNNDLYLVSLSKPVKYYKVTPAANVPNTYVNDGEIEEILEANVPADVKVVYETAIQNYANWFQYHRKRWLTSMAALTNLIPKINNMKVGFYTINNNIKSGVINVNVPGQTDNSTTLVTSLSNYIIKNQSNYTGTPLRNALDKIGKYYQTGVSGDSALATSPLDRTTPRGHCQQNFAVLFTDGYWYATADSISGIGHQDQGAGNPYQDSIQNTLADVAMKYYKTDLFPSTPTNDKVPTNTTDQAKHQHMVTYTVALGLDGSLTVSNYGNPPPPGTAVPWTDPFILGPNKIDDLYHAAVNGRGKFFSSKDPDALARDFDEILNDIEARTGTAASVSVNGEEVVNDLVFYQGSFKSGTWTGDIVAKKFSSTGGTVDYSVISNTPLWSTNTQLSNVSWDTGRKIVTYKNVTGTNGIPFRYTSLSTTQQGLLDSTATNAQKILNYIRGDFSNERRVIGATGFRDRIIEGIPARIGDIVHSAPLFVKGADAGGADMVFVGSNDGMLHAVNATSGNEVFAYIPNLVFANLKELSKFDYQHKFYVDATPFAKKVTLSTGARTLMVGGLGAGGKGIYCLDITNAGGTIASESDAAALVKWEFPKYNTSSSSTDANTDHVGHMGLSLSKPYIINTRAGAKVVFGNGYNSSRGEAVLFVLNADTGSVDKMIRTNISGDNGLSNCLPVDGDADGVVDYVYAGDLKGNMWKFDFTSSNSSSWGLAYGSNPLFQARDASNNPQPITARPDVMKPCKPGMNGYMVVFGTGKYLGDTDISDNSTQTVYGIWDYGDDSDDNEYIGAFQRSNSTTKLSNQPSTVSLLKQEVDWTGSQDGEILRVLTSRPSVWKTLPDTDTTPAGQSANPSNSEVNYVGWYFDLPQQKERVVNEIIIRAGNAIVISTVPGSTDPCIAGGESWLMEIDACTGGRPDSSHLDRTKDGTVNSSDDVLVLVEDPLYPGDSSKKTNKRVSTTGMHYSSMLYPPSIVNANNDTEIKYMSTSDGSITSVREKAEKRGIYYWRSY